jgi:hypothetical protein
MAGDHRIERFDRVHIVTGVGEEYFGTGRANPEMD